ncbi:MAG: hypothetical protein ACRC2T_00655, partial [Thermoguttaceae bacterium]
PEKVVAVMKKLHDRGVGVLGMKIFGEGKCDTAEMREKSLKYAMNLGCMDAMTIGFTEKSQIDETLGMISRIGNS